MIKEINDLIVKSPSGPIDKDSMKKLIEEYEEFNKSIEDGDELDSILELADVVYYCFKLILFCLSVLCKKYGKVFVLNDALNFCEIKYSTRQKNKKNHELERQAIFNKLYYF